MRCVYLVCIITLIYLCQNYGNSCSKKGLTNFHELPTNSQELLLLFPQFLLQRTHHLAVVAQVVTQGVVAIPVDKHI